MGGGSFLLAYRKILTNHLSIESSVQAGLKSVLLIMAECELSSTDAMTVSSVVDMRAAAMGIGERHGDATKGMGKGRMYLLDHPFFLGGGGNESGRPDPDVCLYEADRAAHERHHLTEPGPRSWSRV